MDDVAIAILIGWTILLLTLVSIASALSRRKKQEPTIEEEVIEEYGDHFLLPPSVRDSLLVDFQDMRAHLDNIEERDKEIMELEIRVVLLDLMGEMTLDKVREYYPHARDILSLYTLGMTLHYVRKQIRKAIEKRKAGVD